MLRFLSLGSGSSGNCYLLCDDNDILMIDAGIELRKLKKYFDEYGINATHIHYILLTHDHIDHVKAVGSVSREWHIDVYATKKVHNAITNNKRLTHPIEDTHIRHLTQEEPFTLGTFHITPFAVPHDSHTNTGYRITHGDTVFAFVTDIGEITNTIIKHLQGVQHLAVEANYDPHMLLKGKYPFFLKRRIAGPTGHLSNKESAQLITECLSADLQNVWLCHLSEENNHPDKALQTIQQYIDNQAVIKHPDLLITPLNRQKPSGFFTF